MSPADIHANPDRLPRLWERDPYWADQTNRTIARMLRQGIGPSEIARQTGVSDRTVYRHKKRLQGQA